MNDLYWQSHDFINQLIEQVPAAIFWKNKNSVFLGCNRFFANLAAIDDPKDIIGKTDFDLPWGKYQAERYIADDREVMRSQKPKLNIEESQTLDDGQEYVLLTNKIPLFDDKGEVIGILAIFHDITRRKMMERSLEQAKINAEMANHAKSEFIANMSHDIRTPLTGVIGLSFHLYEQLIDPHSKQIAKWIYDSGEQLLGLLNSVLDLVDIDNTNDEDLNCEVFFLDKLIDELIDLHIPAAISKGIEIKTILDDRLPLCVKGDRAKLYRIILNLFSNAIKFTDEGVVEAEIHLLEVNSSRAHFQFKIMDTGIGIPLELQPYVFERFYRAHPSYKGLFKGHGLGLHIAKKYVELMGGGLRVSSIPHQGSTFFFDIWMDIAHSPIQLSVNTSNSIPFIEDNGFRFCDIQLMLVEDNAIAQIMFDIYAKTLGIKLDIFQNAMDAFSAFQNKSYHMLITDIGLPDCSGFELAHMIRAYEKENMLIPVPIIGLTAHAHNGITSKCLACGMQDILSKPISKHILSETILSHCGLKNSATYPPDSEQGHQQLAQELFSYSAYEGFPLLEMDVALKQFGSYPLLTQMLRLFLQDDLIHAKEQSISMHESNNLNELGAIVHRIHGATVYCATERLKRISVQLETAIVDRNHIAIRNLFPIWYYILQITIAEIEKQLSKNHELKKV
jgi:PAS domain S-box-containing protein